MKKAPHVSVKGYDWRMGTAVAFALKPLVAFCFVWLIGRPAVQAVRRMKDGRLKRLLLTRITKD
jgi:hypothetical protein